MPRPSRWSRDAVLEAAARQDGLLTAAQLTELGVQRSTLSRSDQLGGMFTRVLPGVHAVGGPRVLSERQRDRAALLYAGEESVLTAVSTLRGRRLRAAQHPSIDDGTVRVLIPHSRRRVSAGFVIAERTVAMPACVERDGLRHAPAARAVLDAARHSRDEDAVRALVFEAVQRGVASPESLERERVHGQIRGSRFTRLALEQVYAGARSVPEADLREAFLRAGWTELEYNPRLLLPDGSLLAVPDVYEASGVCLEVDSREHHFSVSGWEATMRRHARLTAHGLAVIHVPPSRISADVESVIAEFGQAVRSRSGHAAPQVVVQSSAYRPDQDERAFRPSV